MKVRPPKPFFFEGGTRAVLLLHGFTGNSTDVRQLGRYLYKRGYTCYGPHYKGHAVPPEELMKTTPADWWQDVREAYGYLNRLGYREIAVCGLSIGGVFSLKCGYTFPVKGLIPMCAPAGSRKQDRIYAGVLKYAENYKIYQGENDREIAADMSEIRKKVPELLAAVRDLIRDVRLNLYRITVPSFVVQGRLDEMIDTNSAEIIYDEIQSERKQLNWYEQSTHVITLGTEKAQLDQDIYAFLESLDWSVS
ncbi:carboxylesterase [Sporolactobacillus sp. CQH2019]|uniref:alpha/beta hydrolase n=1 Tax=Sporolactobacillus sp. CQH2019 TaxID=3023512 RepID=UPI00236844D0|nr:carboxylesterase [Sporolactobacillus sp. CQH2019]MDD9148119.1 carboxylesterase [Sporolactobacillus sp. CQH2019]